MVPNGRNPPKISSLDVISRVFSTIFQKVYFYFRFRGLHAIHIQNLSNSCRNKYDQSISRIFESYFLAGFFAIWPNCGPVQWTRGLVLAAVICNTFDGTLHNFDIVASDLEIFCVKGHFLSGFK